MGITIKQKAILDFITDYSQETGCAPTQREILEHFGFKSFGSVQRYIKYLVDAGYLESDWNARRGLKLTGPTEGHQSTTSESNLSEVPLLGLVAAGNPIEALENPNDFISLPKDMLRAGHRYFALTISGDSMINAGILDGDTVLCRQATGANQGQIVVAVIDGEATLKYYYRHADHIELRPANERLRPIIVTQGDFKIAGILAGLVRSYE